jgi:hypothetical protein
MENWRRRVGLVVVLLSGLGLVGNRFTQVPSDWLGRLLCDERYLLPVAGIVGDRSCGFNVDVLVAALLLGSLVIGIVLLLARAAPDADRGVR